MHKKLTEEKLAEIIEAGIHEFADKGYEAARTNAIAMAADISVGVLFKYYNDKESLFMVCVQRSLDILRGVLQSVMCAEHDLVNMTEALLRALINFSREHSDYIRMYHMITTVSDKEIAYKLAEEIESVTAGLFRDFIAKAQESGEIRKDISPERAAFLFDSMLMVIQFTFCCDYYKQRYLVYTGTDADDESVDELFIRQFILFLDGALAARSKSA